MTILNRYHTQKAFIFYSLMNQQIQVVLSTVVYIFYHLFLFFIIYNFLKKDLGPVLSS